MATDAVAAKRVPAATLRVAWGWSSAGFPTDWTLEATNESTRLIEASWSRQLDLDSALGLGRGPAAEMTVTLANYDQRYSPYNSSGALYSSISAAATLPDGVTVVRYPTLRRVPIQLRVGFGANLVDAFSGYIDETTDQYGTAGNRLTVRCLDRALKLIETQASTAMFRNIQTDDWTRYIVDSVGGIPITYANTDRGFFYLPYAWLDDENLWGEVQAIAASEGGYAFFDESGAFQLRNAAWWAQYADSYGSQFEFTAARFSDLTPGYGYDSVATGVVVEYEPRTFGGEQVLWKSADTIIVPPGGTTIEARFEYPAEYIYAPKIRTDWLPINAGGVDMSSEVSATLTAKYAQRATITFGNDTHETAYVPSIKLRGRAVIGGPAAEIDRNVSAPLVPTNIKRISGNPYIQQAAQAQMIADLACDRMQYPRMVYRLSGVPAIPWLQLGDRITITASEPITTSRTAIITKLSFRWSATDNFTMTVDAVDTLALYLYSAFFVIGTSDYGGERMFR